jgi:erythromycin esterase-like protein
MLVVTLLSMPLLALSVSSIKLDVSKEMTPIDQLISDVCNKAVVVIGEDSNHGGGETIKVKGKLLKRLVNQCGFNTVMFESPFYDLNVFQEQLKDKSASKAKLSDAIGALWVTAREFDPTLDYLFRQAQIGAINILGLDPQAGSRSSYYQKYKLANRLSDSLNGSRKEECVNSLSIHNQWRYDDNNPFGKNTISELQLCMSEVQASLHLAAIDQPLNKQQQDTLQMAMNFSKSLIIKGREGFNIRDSAMADNFNWHRGQLDKGSKVIIWTASIHAARQISRVTQPLGFHLDKLYANNMASIAITAQNGHFLSMSKKEISIKQPATGALEQSIDFPAGQLVGYLNYQQLEELGEAPSHVLNYQQPQSLPWYQLFDGVLILKNERPKHIIGLGTPQQVAW